MSSVQETLRSQRERLGQSRATAAAATKLPDHVPAALESGELPLEDATTLAYVRIYARHLGLDAEELLRDCAVDEPFDVDDGPMLRQPPGRRRGLRAGRVPLAFVLGILGLGCLIFAASLVRGDAGGPVEVQLGPSASPEATGTDGADAAAPAVAPDAADTARSQAPAPDPAASLAARAPQETRVQLLHHGGIAQATVDEVHAVLQSLGYQVIHVNALTTAVGQTSVQAVEGWMAEAQALRQRDPRFGNVEPNQVFSTEVDLHVIIGTDWPGQV